ncbi:hypothetical protein E1A91_A12G128700v1 [Gossypium mustelinum]|uniref:Fold protein n=1 Tax=Gossypium mustelinum TaxID=34275 RepID=A0A5D2WTS0_GOSMU|nr:hypothetical protein E1A91_A12G128700v1 [Gossypium mustelinum]
MASDESMTVVSSIHDDEYDDIDVGFHPHNLSRLSMCNSSMYTNEDDDDDDDMGMYMSRLSIESFDADVDEEFTVKELSSDSDGEPSCYSLPATPPRRRSRLRAAVVKDYASENEAQRPRGRRSKDLRKRRVIKGRWIDKEMGCKHEGKNKSGLYYNYSHSNYSGSFSGESEGGVVVITRPKGGKRSLCMDMEEVKACRDLGLELEMPGRVSLSGSAIDNTSSGGNSPIANWCISSPGDDPRDVKARLKVWAQAVALASTSRHCS